MDLSTEYEEILLTSEGTNARCKQDEGGFPTIWTGQDRLNWFETTQVEP